MGGSQPTPSLQDPDTIYLWQAMKEPDADKFCEAMQIEIDDHMKGEHWIVVPIAAVPKHCAIFTCSVANEAKAPH